jgi:hypothetical protein
MAGCAGVSGRSHYAAGRPLDFVGRPARVKPSFDVLRGPLYGLAVYRLVIIYPQLGIICECGVAMAAERREMMCTGKCHKITEHVYLVVIDEYANSNIDPNRGKFMKLSHVLGDYNPLNKAIFGKGYQ